MLPLPLLLGGVTKYWKIALIGVVIVTMSIMSIMIKSKNSTIEDLRVDLRLQEMQTASFEQAVQAQNKQIQDLIAEGESQKEKIHASQQAINNIRLESQKEIIKIRNEKIGASCDDTMNWMLEKVKP